SRSAGRPRGTPLSFKPCSVLRSLPKTQPACSRPKTAGCCALETELEVVEGMQFDRGYISPYFITNADKMRVEMEVLISWSTKRSCPDCRSCCRCWKRRGKGATARDWSPQFQGLRVLRSESQTR